MRDILLHVHIFKNAGTTLDHSLRNCFGEKFCDHRDDQEMMKGKQEYLESYLADHSELQALSSHSIHFIPQSNEKFRYFPIYMLRHPIERMRSVYDFEHQQQIDQLGPNKAKELSLAGYLKWRMRDDVPATIRNCQTIFLSGQGPSADNLAFKFETAKSNIKQSLVGITHRYDESMEYFHSKLKRHFPDLDLSYVRKNVTDKNPDKPLIVKLKEFYEQLDSPRLRTLIEKKNKFDLKLFKKCDARLTRKLKNLAR